MENRSATCGIGDCFAGLGLRRAGIFVPAKTVGQMVYLSGVISIGTDGVITGTVGAGRTIEQGYAAARACSLTHLTVLKRHLGSLDAVKSIVGVNGYVNAVAGFAIHRR